MSARRVLLTGGSGFIGSHLTESFKERGETVGWISRSKPSVEGVQWIQLNERFDDEVLGFEPDLIVHVAAAFDNSDIAALIDCNVLLPIKILELLKRTPVGKRNFVYTGSYWQNGDFKKPHIPIDLYSASKKSLKSFVDYYHAYHDVNAIELVNFGTYGAKDKRGKLLDQLIQSAKTGASLNISPGEQSLNLVHIDDVCRAYVVACDLLSGKDVKTNSCYSIASDKEIRVIDLVALVEKTSGKKLNVSIGGVPYREVEVFKPVYNEAVLPGWNQEIELDHYIEKCFER